MNSIIIQGGLGNQLFQIFMLISYSIKHNKQFVIPKNLQSWDKRITYWDTIFLNLMPFLVSNNDIEKYIEIKEPSFKYTELSSITENVVLNGYFQSYKYFENNYTEVCDKLGLYQIRNIIKQKYFTQTNNINENNKICNTISLHFRMGDYKNMPNHHPLISDNYYINSLFHIISVTKQKKWNVIYTCEEIDDEIVLSRIKHIKNVFKELNFLKIDNSLKDYEQMLLMSVCDHNIIANSSFSWWSAYINDNPQKVVCYPSIWFGIAYSNFDTIDLYPDSWNKINV
jgi:hypothetical protein